MEWISVEDELPEEGKIVIGLYCVGNWIDEDNPETVNHVHVALKRGISLEERAALPDDVGEEYKGHFYPRNKSWSGADQHDEKDKPYQWVGYNIPMNFKPNQISHWCPIPQIKHKEKS